MRPHPPHTGSHWDGSPRHTPPRRSLQIAANSPSRLLRTGQTGRCRHCGNRIDWYPRPDDRPIALHPTEVATADVSQACRWHLSGGIAHPHDDGSGWCRIPHATLCPQQTPHSRTSNPRLTPLHRQLALRSRRLIDTGAFTPQPRTPATAAPEGDDRHPARPVVRILLVNYLGEGPIEDIRCVAQTRQRHRCTHPILDPARSAGRWMLLPTQPRRGQLTLPDTHMAVYDLSRLPYAEQLRWRAQRCTVHAATPAAADLALAGWQPFDPLLHTAHIHTQLPAPKQHRPRRR
ncbi:DUF6083 domain-containing protein [Streptomyces diastatochromogenes]|uniref:Uncharacterized protein n=1 Tax=Streptomyces diastatochromogenes TaxID=42236 RepID=A0A233SXZ0_STRDA|nr:DUF6083 domain-containing protein [Streptomyces diastatochromogenes]MCZ0991779.1 DUF6083 domain-containing protein [Streptomyces diastatochromogenes]OXZ00512.1 hypothetical protein BEK98_00100 [Streptomyces diastatochromogenes]